MGYRRDSEPRDNQALSMPIERKPSPPVVVTLIGDFTDPPDVPDDVVERFPSMDAYKRYMGKWWDDLKRQLQRYRGIIMDALNKLSAKN